MRKIIYSSLLTTISLIVVIGAIACTSNPGTPIDEAAVRVYADPVTETTLKGLSENSLSEYVKYGNAGFKSAVTQMVFDKAVAQINGPLGSYVSITFLRGEVKDGYTIVHYKVKYTKGDVGVRMVFDKDQLVAGQWFE